jgi:hypothetical protein
MKLGWISLLKQVVLAMAVLLALVGCQSGKAISEEQAASSMILPTNSTVAASTTPSAPSPTVKASPLQLEATPNVSPLKEPDDGDKQIEASLSVECGKVAIGSGAGKTELPLYCLRVKRAVEDPGLPRPEVAPKEPLVVRSYIIPSGVRARLAAFWLNTGDETRGILLLAPKGWKAESADMGADGSIGIRLTDPQDSSQYVDYRDSAGCSGCALTAAAQYFPNMVKLAEDQGFTLDKGPDFIGRTELTQHLMAYSLKPAKIGLETNGVAYQNLDARQDIPFKLEEVRMNKSSHDLSTAILNLFAKLNTRSGD